MRDTSSLGPAAVQRDGGRCQACGIAERPVLAVHHIVPTSLGGRDVLSNLTTLCANCHRIVHWLSAGDRSVDGHAYGLGSPGRASMRLLALARRIRRRRHRVVGPDHVLTTSVPLHTAMAAVIRRNGLDKDEAGLFRRCFSRAVRAIAPNDRQACSVRLVRGARFISVNANNHLALRAPAWDDARQRIEGNIILIWPQNTKPSILSATRFRRESRGRFRLIPHFNLSLTWDECRALSAEDWRVYRQACHDALTLVRTGRRTSNVHI